VMGRGRDFDPLRDDPFGEGAYGCEPVGPTPMFNVAEVRTSRWRSFRARLADARVERCSQQAPHRRSVLVRWCLVLALVAAVILGVAGYCTFDAVDFTATEPFAVATYWFIIAVLAGCASFVTFVLSMVAVARSGLRGIPLLALAAAVVLPALAIIIAVPRGIEALQANVVHSVSSATGPVARINKVVETWHIPVRPLPDLLPAIEPP
jgi:hypothetical protein